MIVYNTHRSRGPASRLSTVIILIFMGGFFWLTYKSMKERPATERRQQEQSYFGFMSEVILENSDSSVQHNIGDSITLTKISPKILDKYKPLLALHGFKNWQRAASPSKSFRLKNKGIVLYKADEGSPVTYSIAEVMRNGQMPVVLLDENKNVLYCLMTTEFTR